MNSDEVQTHVIQLLTTIAVLAIVFILGLFAIPIAIAAIIFIYAYRQYTKPNYSDLPALDRKVHALGPPSEIDFCNTVYEQLPHDFRLGQAIGEIYEWEGFSAPPKLPTVLNPIEAARYRDQAATYINAANNTDFLPTLIEAVEPLVIRGKRNTIFRGTRPIRLEEVEPLAYRFEHPRYFKKLHRRLTRNLGQKPKEPYDYIRHTPFELIAERPVSVALKNRFEHIHILGGTGAGKTQLIQYLISRDLQEDCTIIVIDNQRQMIPKLAKLGLDTQYISPHYPLALNVFDMPQSHHTASLLQYVLSGIMNAPLTPKQELVFQFGVTLMLALKGNIHTFQDLLDGKQFDLSGVDDTTRRFFETEFYNKGRDGYESTRKEISWRIWSLLKNPVLRDMFAATENRCPLELDRKLILIDTDIDLLQDYTGMFGRFFIAQLLQKAYERFANPGRPVYVYIDECYYYLDQNIGSMLETARKAEIGLTMAHQFLGQITEPKVAAALMSLTSTKFAAQLSPSDAYAMAQAMRTTPDFIHAQEKLHFALWQKGEDTVSIEVPTGVIEDMDTTEPDHDEMVRRYGRQPATPTSPPASPEPPPSRPDKVGETGDW